jgi:hypothetical protein
LGRAALLKDAKPMELFVKVSKSLNTNTPHLGKTEHQRLIEGLTPGGLGANLVVSEGVQAK